MKQKSLDLTCEELSKAFGSVSAVSKATVSVSSGEIVALVGTNGSGKSTLMKMIYGSVLPDSGCTKVNGSTLKSGDPKTARAHGIEMVFQDKDAESKLCPDMTVLENLFLGRELTSTIGFVRYKEMRAAALKMIEQYHLSFPALDSKFDQLSGGQQKTVALGRALLYDPRVLLLDEPSSSLGLSGRNSVQKAMLELKNTNVAIMLCSHSLEEVMSLSNRVIAMHAGEVVATIATRETSEESVALLMSK